MISVPAAPLRQEVVRALREDIQELNFRPGERLIETALCDRYGVSRTVVRESLRELENESLITMLPHRGPIVTVLTAADIAAIYEVRADLEGLAGELFARRATDDQAAGLVAHQQRMRQCMASSGLAERLLLKDEFYSRLLEGACNPVLGDMLARVHVRIGIFRHFAFRDNKRVRLSLDELDRIVVAAAVRRDPAAARDACMAHISRAAELAVKEYAQHFPQSVRQNAN